MTPEEALNYVSALCNKAEYCRSEIAEKLRKKGLSGAETTEVLRILQAQRLVYDRRYAMAYARQKFRNQYWGRRKIEIELRRKRISTEIISEALSQISGRDYAAALRTVMAKKARTFADPTDRAARTAIARYAIARGFEPSLVFDAL